MIKLKTANEIAIMRRGGKILALAVKAVAKAVKPGVKSQDLNNIAVKIIKDAGGVPSFEGYTASWAKTPFPTALCVSVNEEVVHGFASPAKIIKTGDVVGIDCGLKFEGFYTDMAKTVIAGRANSQTKKLVKTAERALTAGIKQVKPGNYISDIAQAIQTVIEGAGFSVVRQLVGHGVGHKIHEEPEVPNYFDQSSRDLELKPGMVLALEPMANLGSWEVETLGDGWTVVTRDRSLSAHFEHTVAVTKIGCLILTK